MKLAATKLSLGTVEDWVEQELNGYKSRELPEYRIINGRPVYKSRYGGQWNPLGPLVRQNLGKRPLGAPEALRKSRVNQQQAHVNRPFGLRRVVQQGLHSQLFFCSYLLYRRSRST